MVDLEQLQREDAKAKGCLRRRRRDEGLLLCGSRIIWPRRCSGQGATPAHRPPESPRSLPQGYDGRGFWSLGCIAYEFLLGSPVHRRPGKKHSRPRASTTTPKP